MPNAECRMLARREENRNPKWVVRASPSCSGHSGFRLRPALRAFGFRLSAFGFLEDMHDLFFYFFATLTLLCGFLVIANPFSRNPVTSAMFLVLSIVSLAGLFVLLHAFFLAAVQILVYAGAVMVLFLFVIMLLDLKEEARRRMRSVAVAGGVVAVVALAAIAILAVI